MSGYAIMWKATSEYCTVRIRPQMTKLIWWGDKKHAYIYKDRWSAIQAMASVPLWDVHPTAYAGNWSRYVEVVEI
jgi:hypothetical protein